MAIVIYTDDLDQRRALGVVIEDGDDFSTRTKELKEEYAGGGTGPTSSDGSYLTDDCYEGNFAIRDQLHAGSLYWEGGTAYIITEITDDTLEKVPFATGVSEETTDETTDETTE